MFLLITNHTTPIASYAFFNIPFGCCKTCMKQTKLHNSGAQGNRGHNTIDKKSSSLRAEHLSHKRSFCAKCSHVNTHPYHAIVVGCEKQTTKRSFFFLMFSSLLFFYARHRQKNCPTKCRQTSLRAAHLSHKRSLRAKWSHVNTDPYHAIIVGCEEQAIFRLY